MTEKSQDAGSINSFKIPDDLSEYFSDSNGYLYCGTQEDADEYFDILRKNGYGNNV